jgi:pyridoxal 5'-phosphate synthase pdxT subunit
MKIGILDIQGSVEEHFDALGRLGPEVEPVLVKKAVDFEGLDGLIIPGGESTTISKLLRRFELDRVLKDRVQEGMAVWGTCAGAILLGSEIVESSEMGSETGDVEPLGLIDISVERNAYGRQLDSFEAELEFDGKNVPGVFIRAPRISRVGDGVEVLAKFEEEIVAARDGRVLVTTFHPEMTDDLSVYRYFVGMCEVN